MATLLDTHQHLFYRDRFQYAWSDSLPALAGRDFTIADYQGLTAGRDVAGTIFMEVDIGADYRDETRFIAELAQDPTNRLLGIVSSCRPEEEAGFEAWLEECADLPVVGFRRILHEAPDALSQTTVFRRNLRKIGDRGLVFDMIFRADQLAVAADLARACDGMRLVLDHCGVPDIAGGAFDEWRQGIDGLAALPHVACKLSGVLAYCAPDHADLNAVRPYLDHVIEAFGPDRLLWGSDWPVVDLRSSLPDWIDIFRAATSHLSEEEQARICHRNAEMIYGVQL